MNFEFPIMNNRYKKSKGVTLIETLIYVGITAILVSSIVLLTQVILNTSVRVKTSITLEENLQFAMVQIVGKIQKAANISAPISGTANSLTLGMTSAPENPTVFSLSNGAIMMTEGSGQALPVTSNEIEITNLSFTRLDAMSAAVQMQITGQLRNVSPSIQTTHTISDTIVLRR